MSEPWGQEGTTPFADQPAANDALTAGALLRRAREAAGLHVAAMAVSLKVPVRKLEALEEDRWDLLPDAVFARALAATVCRTLKIDPQPVLDRMPQTGTPRLIHSDEGINTPFRAPSDGAAPSWLNQLSRPTFLIVFALLLGALVLVLLPSMQRDDSVAAASSPTAILPPQPAGVAGTVVEPVASVAQPMAAMAPASATLPVAAASATSAVVPAKSLAAASAAKPASSAASAAKPASSAAATAVPATIAANPVNPASGIVVFRTKSESWVEVTDANGVLAVRRLLAPGEAAGVSGALPLQVTVGRADATEVQVRGKPFDLRSVSRDNVARFEVK
jgi:cytoskeleton protein RodZ